MDGACTCACFATSNMGAPCAKVATRYQLSLQIDCWCWLSLFWCRLVPLELMYIPSGSVETNACAAAHCQSLTIDFEHLQCFVPWRMAVFAFIFR